MGNKIILSCSVCASRNYTTNKNQSSSPERLTVKKYCKSCKIHTIHKETK